MTEEETLYGLLAEFQSGRDLVAAASCAHAAAYRQMDAFSPHPVNGLAAALGRKRNAVAPFCLLGGIIGGSGGYFMQDYAMSTSYALNVGGRPLHGIPPFIPITFELTILCAAIFGVVSMLLLNGLPRLHHPVLGVAGFERATTDGFFLCIQARDAQFELGRTRRFLEGLGAVRITEVPV